MKTAIKWVAVLCVIGWAVRNPGQVSADVGRLMGAGQSLVSSVMDAGGSALSGATNGLTGGSSPAVPAAPAATPGH